jgi:hypothetical protein
MWPDRSEKHDTDIRTAPTYFSNGSAPDDRREPYSTVVLSAAMCFSK